jgi:hypothetical protein
MKIDGCPDQVGHDEVGAVRGKKICGMIALAIISGANPIPYGAACDRDLGHAARRHVRACRLIKHDRPMIFARDNVTRCPAIMLSCNGSDGSSIKTHLAPMRCMRMRRPENAAAVRFKKPATSFPARARLLR